MTDEKTTLELTHSAATAAASQAPPNTAPETEPVAAIATPRARVGVIIACLLGTLPIIALALVRGQSNGAEIPAAPTIVTEMASAPTEVIDSAPQSAVSPEFVTRDSEVADAPLGPRFASAAAVPVPQTKDRTASTRAAQPSAEHSLGSGTTPAAQPGAPIAPSKPGAASRLTRGANSPSPRAPVQSPWFEYR